MFLSKAIVELFMARQRDGKKRPPYDDIVRKLSVFETEDYKMYFLKPRKVEAPKPTGSVTWKFEVENLLGWTMGSITFQIDWEKRTHEEKPPCSIISCECGIKDSFTAPLIDVTYTCDEVSTPRPSERCPEGIMDCCTVKIEVLFSGPLNSVPYKNWFRICADCSQDWGPR